jgi:hypothetical protein
MNSYAPDALPAGTPLMLDILVNPSPPSCHPVITCFTNAESWNFKGLLLISFLPRARGSSPHPSLPRLRGRVREGASLAPCRCQVAVPAH